jgi:methionyl-tRNA formyltransferase
MKIVFMGTPGFSVGILEAIQQAKIEIAAIVTVADKPAGRGQLMHESPVKQFAVTHQIPVLQPLKLKDEQFIQELRNFHADVFVVVAFRMLPKEVWSMPKHGTFNLHASLLPDYRGAAPINWTIINGDRETGVSTFFIDEAIDTGNVIDQVRLSIGENETAGELHDRMMEVGGQLVVNTIRQIETGNVVTKPQAEMIVGEMRPAPKLFKDNTRIDWTKSGNEIHNLVRGLNPYPTAWTVWRNQTGEEKQVKILETKLTDDPGKQDLSLEATKTAIYFHAKNQKLEIIQFQFEGKRKMSANEWLVGNKLTDWSIVF